MSFPVRRVPAAPRLVLVATGVIASVVMGSATGQVPPSRLRAIDFYRTAQLDTTELERRFEPRIREIVDAMSASDWDTVERIGEGITEAIRAGGDFAEVSFSLTTSFEEDANVIDVVIELVDAADAATRLAFNPAPTGSVEDPNGVLLAWDSYQQTAFDLVNTRQMLPDMPDDCPALHCVFGFDHELLAPFLDAFETAAHERRDALLRVLREDADAAKRGSAVFVLAHVEDAGWLVRELVPALDDPDSGVRNNVMRVLGAIARTHETIEIPFEPLTRRIDDPSGSCRNKAAYLIAALAGRAAYRDEMLAIAPQVMRLLRLEKPNNHEPAYEILKTISGESFGDRDYDAWERWIAANPRRTGPE